MSEHSEALAAVARLQALVAAGPITEEAPELIRLSDLACSVIIDPALREKVAENLISALTVIRFASVFAHDPEPGRQQATKILGLLANAPSA